MLALFASSRRSWRQPIKIGGGVVRVKDELKISFRVYTASRGRDCKGAQRADREKRQEAPLCLICRLHAALISFRAGGRSGFVLPAAGRYFSRSGSEVSIGVGRGSTYGSTSDFHCRSGWHVPLANLATASLHC
jgi:hypothetical protein